MIRFSRETDTHICFGFTDFTERQTETERDRETETYILRQRDEQTQRQTGRETSWISAMYNKRSEA